MLETLIHFVTINVINHLDKAAYQLLKILKAGLCFNDLRVLIGFNQQHGDRICLHKSGRLISKHGFYSGSLAGLKGTGVFEDVFLTVIVEYIVGETIRRRDLRLIDVISTLPEVSF